MFNEGKFSTNNLEKIKENSKEIEIEETELSPEQENLLKDFSNNELKKIIDSYPDKEIISNIDIIKDEFIEELRKRIAKKSGVDLSIKENIKGLTEYLFKITEEELDNIISAEAIYNDPKEIHSEFLEKYDILDTFEEYSDELFAGQKSQEKFPKENEIMKKLKEFVEKREANVEYDLLKKGVKEYLVKIIKEAA